MELSWAFQFKDARKFFLGPCPKRASTKPGTWNIPEHPGTFRNRANYHKINEKKKERKEEKAIKETTEKQTNKKTNKI